MDMTEAGYYFVLTKYKSGRCGYSERKYATEQGARRRAAAIRKRADVKSATVCYQTGLTVDIKKFI